MKNSIYIQILPILLNIILISSSTQSFSADWTKVPTKAQIASAKHDKRAAIAAADKELDVLVTQFNKNFATLEINIAFLEIDRCPSDIANEIIRLKNLYRKISGLSSICEAKHKDLRGCLKSDISMMEIWQPRVADAELRATKIRDKAAADYAEAETKRIAKAAERATKIVRERAAQSAKDKAAHAARIAAAKK